MKKINLRDIYPDIYEVDIFLEVNDEVQEVFLKDKREKHACERQMYRYKAQYSLDCQNGIEAAVLEHSQTPEEILEDKQQREQIYTTVMNLPKKQARRPQGCPSRSAVQQALNFIKSGQKPRNYAVSGVFPFQMV